MTILDEAVTVQNGRPTTGAPVSERHGDDFVYTWKGEDDEERDVVITVSRIREQSDGTRAEITVTAGTEEIHWSRLNLEASGTRSQLIKTLLEAAPEIDWRRRIERVCRDTVRALRVGSPTVLLSPRPATGPAFLIEPMLPLGETSCMYATGGSGKGWNAGVLALAAMNGLTLPGGIRFAAARTVPVLYLDYESTQADLEERLYLLGRGLGCASNALHYRRMTRPLSDDAAALRADVSRLGIGLVVLDSLAPACGPEPEGADAVIRTMNDLRAFGPSVTRLVIAHVSKTAAESKGADAKPYGSIFTWNLSRSVWELRRSDDDGGDDLVVGLYHRKANRGRLHPPIGLRFAFAEDSIGLASCDLSESSDLIARTSTPQRIRAFLKPGALTAAELTEALGISGAVVSATLRRMASRGQVVRLPDTRPIKWGLPA